MFTSSPTGWVAVFEERAGDGHPRFTQVPVEKFSDTGNALVVDRQSGRLTVAHDRSGFVELTECERLVAVVASPPGWRAVAQKDAGEWSEAVVAWAVSDRGIGVPLTAVHDSGYLSVAFTGDPVTHFLRGPDKPDLPTAITESPERG